MQYSCFSASSTAKQSKSLMQQKDDIEGRHRTYELPQQNNAPSMYIVFFLDEPWEQSLSTTRDVMVMDMGNQAGETFS